MNRLDSTLHHKTNNKRGFMHPITEIGKKFIAFSQENSPVIDVGCAYGNTVLAALDAGAPHIIAYDMEQSHLDSLQDKLTDKEKDRVTLIQGTLPDKKSSFAPNSIAAIHASLVLPYLSPEELDECLENFHTWLKPNGKLFILCYSIFVNELVNDHFEKEYQRRCDEQWKWPGYLEDFSQYSYTNGVHNEHNPALPRTLHFLTTEAFENALLPLGFTLEFSQYLSGKENGAMEDTWHDGREFVGIIAKK